MSAWTFFPWLEFSEATVREIASGTIPERVREALTTQCREALIWVDEGIQAGMKQHRKTDRHTRTA